MSGRVSVDPATGNLVICMDRGDVRVSREQLEAVASLIRAQSVTVALSHALRLAAVGQMFCSVPGCDEPHSVGTDSNGAPRCWDHEQSAMRMSERAGAWFAGDCS